MNTDIGLKIKKARKNIGITQKELATAVSKSERMIQKYENGEVTPSISILNILANKLGVTTNDLLGNTAEERLDNFLLTEEGKEIENYSNDIHYHLSQFIKKIYEHSKLYEKLQVKELKQEKLELLCTVIASELEPYITSITKIKLENELLQIESLKDNKDLKNEPNI